MLELTTFTAAQWVQLIFGILTIIMNIAFWIWLYRNH